MKYRWIVRKDTPAVLGIDRRSSDAPWDEATLIDHLRKREVIGWCVCLGEGEDEIVGFVVFELRLDELAILKWGIDPSFANCGAELPLWNALVRRSQVHGRLHIAVPDGFKVPVGGVEPHKPLIVEARHG